MEFVKVSSININPANPRIIRDERYRKLVKSVAQFPKMLDVRGIVVDGTSTIIGGNQRYRAVLDVLKMTDNELADVLREQPESLARWERIRDKKGHLPANWILQAGNFTPEELPRFIIADNVEFGEHDWDALANQWESEDLAEWGVDVPGFDLSPEELGDDFTLPDGDREPFQQLTFTVADEQATVLKNAIAEIKKTDEFKYSETFGNENSNGNALYLIVSKWEGQKT